VIAAAHLQTPGIYWLSILPVVVLAGSAVAVVLTRAIGRNSRVVFPVTMVIAAAGVAGAGVLAVFQWVDVERNGASGGPYTAIAKMVVIDRFGIFLEIVILGATALALLLSIAYLQRQDLPRVEYVALMLFSASGMLIMATANDLIVVFLALEILSIPLYVLVALDRSRLSSQEAGLKYFILGSFSSAIFLYGVALVYGATGTTTLFAGGRSIAAFLSGNVLLDNGTLLIGLMLLLVGLGFKVAAAPFHMWTPDVYQGAPTPITGFMASATKAAGFAALLRVLYTAFSSYQVDWAPAIWALAVLSLLVGSIAALMQTDLKRMLAYSSISHAGYILIAVQAASSRGREAALAYLLIYAFMVIGSFGVVTVLSGRGDDDHTIAGYRGLAAREPVLAGLLTFFLLAQAGVPLTGGFVAKLGVFEAAEQSHEYALALIGMLAAAIAAYFYLRAVVTMYTAPDGAGSEDHATEGSASGVAPEGDLLTRRRLRIDPWSGIVLVVAVAGVLVSGLAPELVFHFARQATLIG
jgi:NADH-quinone oxidoreductase subunit N